MANTPHHETAKIFEFPNRARSRGQRAADQGASVVSLPLRRAVFAASEHAGCDAWYHEAAMREADKDAGH
jgi:hypothetical protein